MRIIGDLHGKVSEYIDVLRDADESVQVGDFGFGFRLNHELIDDIHMSGDHKFIRGNHDDPAICKERRGWIADGTFDAKRSIMYVGGAWSIDHAWRVPGISWWPDEELSQAELDQVCEDYIKNKPRIMITHDCPTSVAYDLFIAGSGKRQYNTRTADSFEYMFSQHQPDLWVFGHWHKDCSLVKNGTEFVCLDELSYKDIDV